MGLLTLSGSSSYAQAGASQADIGTAATLGFRIRVSGSLILSGGPSGSVALIVAGGAVRMQIIAANAGGTTYVVAAGPGGADSVAAVTASSNYSSGAQYDIRITYGATGRSVAVYTTGGSLVASGSDSGVTLANSDAGNGLVQWGSSTIAAVGTIDGVAIYSGAPPANSDPPRATDSGILWAVLDDTVGQLVEGATELSVLSGGASWGAGGTWDPPAAGITGDGAIDLPALTADGEGSVAVTGAGAAAIPPLATDGEGAVATTGSGATNLPALTVAGTAGAVPITGAGAVSLPALAAASEGTVAITGTGAPSLPAITAEAAGSVAIEGAGATTLPALHAHGLQAGVSVWGFLGDSQTDSYQSPDAGPESSGMGPPHEPVTPGGPGGVLNWLEILVHAARLNPGAWGSFSEPRRYDYEHNWARSGAVMGEVISDQLAGLASQVELGEVTHAALFATGNDWLNPADGLLYAADIYAGNGSQTESEIPLSTLTASIVAQITACMDAVDAALDEADSGGGMVVMTPQDYLAAPPAWSVFSDPVRRGYVTGVIESIHSAVVSYANGLNSAAGYTRFAVIRADHFLLDVWSTLDDGYFTISGVQVDEGGWEYDAEKYDPYFLTLAPTMSTVSHAGTLMGGEYARAFVAAANQIAGVEIEPLTDSEILAAAGLGAGDGAIALPAIEVEGEGTVAITGAGAALLGPLTTAGEGTVGVTGEGALSLPPLQIAGSSEAATTGTGTLELPSLTLAGAGSVAVDGSGSAALPVLEVGAEGSVAVTGEGAVALPALQVSGDTEAGVTGAGALTLAPITAAAEAEVAIEGAGAVVLPALEVLGSTEAVTLGTGAVRLPPLEIEGEGAVGITGSGAAALPALTTDAEATVEISGSGAPSLPPLLTLGAAVIPVTANGGVTLPLLVINGADYPIVLGSGNLVLPGVRVAGTGVWPIGPYRATLTVTSPRAALSVTSRRASLTVEDA